jgi:hypothetical protein
MKKMKKKTLTHTLFHHHSTHPHTTAGSCGRDGWTMESVATQIRQAGTSRATSENSNPCPPTVDGPHTPSKIGRSYSLDVGFRFPTAASALPCFHIWSIPFNSISAPHPQSRLHALFVWAIQRNQQSSSSIFLSQQTSEQYFQPQ